MSPEHYTIGIVVYDGVLTSELIGPAEVFSLASQEAWFNGAKVLLIGVEQQSVIRTAEGIRLTVDATIADDLTLDVLLVPGGSGTNHLLEHEKLNAFIKQQEQNVQWLGSVCSGAFILGSAGVLDGKQATTWFGGEECLQAQFPTIEVVYDKPVVIDQRRITANGGLVSYQAAIILLGRLTTTQHAREICQGLSLDRLDSWSNIEAAIMQPIA